MLAAGSPAPCIAVLYRLLVRVASDWRTVGGTALVLEHLLGAGPATEELTVPLVGLAMLRHLPTGVAGHIPGRVSAPAVPADGPATALPTIPAGTVTPTLVGTVQVWEDGTVPLALLDGISLAPRVLLAQ
jgi:hypothetical protein